jgi:AbrB family looped-hinge helix DNA binding protein
MDKHGRLLIPAQIRNELNYKAGDAFIVRVIDNEMRIISVNKILNEARSQIKAKLSPNTSLSEEFKKMRSQEAALENNKSHNGNK